VVLTVEIVLRLDLLGPRGGERRLRRAERIEFVLRIEFRQHLVGLDLVADPALALDDPPADAEGEIDLVLGADIAGEHHRIANHALFDSDGADRARLRRFGLGFLIAAGQKQSERGRDEKGANKAARCRMTGTWSQVAVLWPEVGQCLSRKRGGRNERGLGPAYIARHEWFSRHPHLGSQNLTGRTRTILIEASTRFIVVR